MRVISGSARGTQLKTIEGMATRPTVDRVKEALFSTIQFALYEARVLDAFAGSGALGIEALSRGAAKAVLVDQSAECQRVIRQNLEKTRLLDKAECLQNDILSALDRMKEPFDIVLLDPPYGQQWCGRVIDGLLSRSLLAESAIVVVEHSAEEELAESYGPLKLIKRYQYGSTWISRYAT